MLSIYSRFSKMSASGILLTVKIALYVIVYFFFYNDTWRLGTFDYLLTSNVLDYYRVFSSNFLYFDQYKKILIFFLDISIFYWFGSKMEKVYGKVLYFNIYILGSFFCNILLLLLVNIYIVQLPDMYIGSSANISIVWGGLLFLYFFKKNILYNVLGGISSNSIGIYSIFNLLYLILEFVVIYDIVCFVNIIRFLTGFILSYIFISNSKVKLDNHLDNYIFNVFIYFILILLIYTFLYGVYLKVYNITRLDLLLNSLKY